MFRPIVKRSFIFNYKNTLPRSSLRTTQLPIYRMSSTTAKVECITSKNAPKAAASYSHATKANGFIYVSGQIPYNTDSIPIEGPFIKKAEQCLNNVVNIVNDSGSSLNKIVKINIFLTDMNNFNEFNQAYGKFFNQGTHLPARSCVAVKELPLGCEVEVEAIALA